MCAKGPVTHEYLPSKKLQIKTCDWKKYSLLLVSDVNISFSFRCEYHFVKAIGQFKSDI